MKFLLVLLTLSFLSTISLAETNTPKGVSYQFDIIRVVDGDTIEFEADFLPDPLDKTLFLRLWGIDTPEKSFRAKCDSEAKLGEEAARFTKKSILNTNKTEIVIYEWDKFGGRVLGNVILDGKSLALLLVENQYAREYFGGTKMSWCKNN